MQKVIICLLGALCTARGQQFCTASCTDDVWNAIAVRPTESATCGDRIEWMMSSGGGSLTELDACQFIAEENPICAPCAPNPIPPPAPTPYSTKLDVASYNIPMWNDVNGNGYTQLWPKLQSGTFDLIGFQESDIQRILSNVPRMNDWGFIGSTPGGPSAGVSLAWDNLRFDEVPGGSGFTYITTGPYAARYVGYARLVDRESGSTIFFANTHGPHIGCPTWLGESWLSVVTDNIASGDLMVFTGDWNCGLGGGALGVIEQAFGPPVAFTGDGSLGFAMIDYIFSNIEAPVSSYAVDGWPSDHPLIGAVFDLTPEGVPTAEPVLQPTAPPVEPPTAEPVQPTAQPTSAATLQDLKDTIDALVELVRGAECNCCGESQSA